MRAQFAGTFSAPPAFIEDMYVPGIRGRTGPDVLQVAQSQRSPGDAGPGGW